MEISALYACFLECQGVTTDSRNCPAGSLFIALKGASFDGNRFAAQALAQGCRYAVVDNPEYAGTDSRILLVDDCLKTLQQLANYHRRKLGTRIIGITGTNGKTTTKELVSAVLKQKYNLLYTQGNLNNHIGVHIAEPDYGIITNVGKAHLEGFGSFEGVIRTKGELYDYLRGKAGSVIFLHHENPYLNGIAQGLECVRYGQTPGLFVSGRLTGCSPFLAFDWTAAGETHSVQTHLIGSYNLDNALAAAAIGTYFGVSAAQVCQALADYVPQNNRSQWVDTGRNRLIVDAYNANPTSMMAALQNFRQLEAPHKVVILGDMKELGPGSVEEHRKVVGFLDECGFERVLLVGGEFAAATSRYEHFASLTGRIDKAETV